MDEVAVPGILAYRKGECFANLVSFLAELPSDDNVTTTSVRTVLERCVMDLQQLPATVQMSVAFHLLTVTSGTKSCDRYIE